jgi:hypothetical protein
MNERIYELAQQAAEYAVLNPLEVKLQSEAEGYETVTVPKQFIDKFVELILEECITVCNGIYLENYPDAEDYERSEEGEAIKEHFGVDE